jgi:hypothetical protein
MYRRQLLEEELEVDVDQAEHERRIHEQEPEPTTFRPRMPQDGGDMTEGPP